MQTLALLLVMQMTAAIASGPAPDAALCDAACQDTCAICCEICCIENPTEGTCVIIICDENGECPIGVFDCDPNGECPIGDFDCDEKCEVPVNCIDWCDIGSLESSPCTPVDSKGLKCGNAS